MSIDHPISDQFIQWFRHSSPYLHAHRGRTFVIVVSGEAVADKHFSALMHDIALLRGLGLRLLLVHGIRPQIEATIRAYGGECVYQAHLRVTDAFAMSCVKRAVGEVRADIEAKLSMTHLKHRVSSGNFITAQPIGIQQGVDYQFTGKVRKIDRQGISQQLDVGDIVLLSPVGYSPSGEAFNLCSNDLGCCVAKSLHADKLIFLHNEGDYHALIPSALRPREVDELSQDKLSFHFMRLLANAADACRNEVQRVHLLDQNMDGVLLHELFTRDGVGIMVSADNYDETRTALSDDVSGIVSLLSPLEEKGVLVRRSREKLETEIEHFTVMERDGLIVACAALYIYPEDEVAEVACVAVHGDYRNQGRGDALLIVLEEAARKQSIKYLFVLTTQTAHWFQEKGFEQAELDQLPMQKQQLYNYQRHSKIFIRSL